MTGNTEVLEHGAAMSPEASRKTKNLGFLCSLLVVAIHAAWPDGPPLSAAWFIRQGLVEGIGRMAVPFFFVVSGFFLARHFSEKGWWRRETAKRLRSLLVPYVVWSLAALLAAWLLAAIVDFGTHRPFGTTCPVPGLRDLPAVFGLDLTEYPLDVPLWYVRCLFVLVLLSPALDWLASRCGRAWLAAAFLLLLFARRIPAGNWDTYLYHASLGLFFFSAGIVLRKTRPPQLPSVAAVFSGLAGLALLAAKMAAAWKGWPFESELGTLSLPFLLHAAWTFVPKSEWPGWLTSCAFPIFLANIVVIRFVAPFLLHAGMGGGAAAFAELAAGVAVPCALAWFLRRCFPRVASIAFGGR